MDVKPGVEYTREEVAQLRDQPELANLLLKGYVATLTIGGNFMFVPWNKAAGGGYSGEGTGSVGSRNGSDYGKEQQAVFLKETLPPIVRRTPQQRLESLLSKVGEDLKLLIYDQDGNPATGEQIRRVAADALQVAETEFKKSEDKRVTKTDGSWQA